MIHSLGLDVAKTHIEDAIRLDRVGMSNIECPAFVIFNGQPRVLLPVTVDAYVSLDEPQKGIHMSRLFLTVQKMLEAELLSPKLLLSIAQEFLTTHKDMSQSAFIKVRGDLPLKRTALVSQNTGWKSYPVELWAAIAKESTTVGANVTLHYSSTCPCSAALSRQLIQRKFESSFESVETVSKQKMHEWLGLEASIAGTPHGQRSEGILKTVLNEAPESLEFIVSIIDTVESSLATPVQSVVKREDEQEFARLNAANLMFAEDAARRMHRSLTHLGICKATSVEARHLESLHPHDAVACIVRGDGFH